MPKRTCGVWVRSCSSVSLAGLHSRPRRHKRWKCSTNATIISVPSKEAVLYILCQTASYLSWRNELIVNGWLTSFSSQSRTRCGNVCQLCTLKLVYWWSMNELKRFGGFGSSSCCQLFTINSPLVCLRPGFRLALLPNWRSCYKGY